MKKCYRGVALILGCLALFGLSGCAGAKTVGKNLPTDKITEFYWTLDASTYPPEFQRYRFYVHDGLRFFAHEKREGDHWPLTEADATVTGTVPLTDADWEAFLACLDGGTVTKREASTSSGGSGPWLYLYWQGDRGQYQVFTFATNQKAADFETLCLRLKGGD